MFHLNTVDLLQKLFNEKFYYDLRPYIPFPISKPRPPITPITMSFPSLSAYSRNMDYLVRMVKSDNVAILLGNQATMYNKRNKNYFGLARTYCTYNGTYPSNDSVIKGMAQFNAASRRIAEANDISFVDIASQVPQTPEYMYDDVHYTAKGDTRVAQIIYKAIVQNKFLDTPPNL